MCPGRYLISDYLVCSWTLPLVQGETGMPVFLATNPCLLETSVHSWQFLQTSLISTRFFQSASSPALADLLGHSLLWALLTPTRLKGAFLTRFSSLVSISKEMEYLEVKGPKGTQPHHLRAAPEALCPFPRGGLRYGSIIPAYTPEASPHSIPTHCPAPDIVTCDFNGLY